MATLIRTLTTLLAFAGAPYAQSADPQSPAVSTDTTVAIATFRPPVPASIDEPRFPEAYRRVGQEGWVQLTFMVSAQGEPYDVAIVDSAGGKRFEAAAIDAVGTWTFEPARLSDRPIDAGMTYRIQFALSDNLTASTAFASRFRRLMKDIENGDQAGADRRLDELRKRDRNLYEEANLDLAAYYYFQKWGTAGQQYPPLRRATAMHEGEGILPDDLITSLLKSRFALEVQLNRFAEARSTIGVILEREQDPEVRARLDAALAQIDALAATDQPIPVAGRISDSSHYFHRLLRKRFHFQNIDGDIAELRLHCDRDYVGFPFDDKLSYTLRDDLGEGGLRVIGTPGTTFTLVEG
ncbi:MAG: energy transducer TonB [Pseudomonadales bacterium]